MPTGIAALPVQRGYPVPWFAAEIDGERDFRVLKPGAVAYAWTRHVCWVCGQSLGPWVTFVLGPMCAVNRNSAEPPAHRECAEWSAQACPFLVRPHAKRRDHDKPADAVEPDGVMLTRNPGVALCWHTTRADCKRREPYWLFDIGRPYATTWWAHGRAATHDEVMASIESGLPSLRELAEAQGPLAIRHLDKLTHRALKLVPA